MANAQTPTPHNAARAGDIAATVLMPGDPLRARFVAEAYLDGARLVNDVRNMLAYTGAFHGKPVTVMASGMGMPSMGIYSHELFAFYGVEEIIRIGSAGGVAEGLRVRDMVAAIGACTDSAYASHYGLPGTFAPTCDYGLLERAVAASRAAGATLHVGNVVSSDHFYREDPGSMDAWRKMGVLAVEMEAAALYMNAARLRKRALALFTITDLPATGEGLSAREREQGLAQMVEIALAAACDR